MFWEETVVVPLAVQSQEVNRGEKKRISFLNDVSKPTFLLFPPARATKNDEVTQESLQTVSRSPIHRPFLQFGDLC